MKVKFICYYLYNIDEICDKYNIRPKDCWLYFKANKHQSYSVCNRPTKIDKPIEVDNDLYSYCNNSNY